MKTRIAKLMKSRSKVVLTGGDGGDNFGTHGISCSCYGDIIAGRYGEVLFSLDGDGKFTPQTNFNGRFGASFRHTVKFTKHQFNFSS